MDDQRFDELARTLAGSGSRRGALRLLVGGALGALAGARGGGGTGSAQTACRRPGASCRTPGQCCSQQCSPAGACLCTATDQCPQPRTPCQKARCARGRCGVVDKPAGTSCDDRIACTGLGTCNAEGRCQPGTPNNARCRSANPCLVGRCEPTNPNRNARGCIFAPAPSRTISCGVGACERTVDACVNGQPQECVPGQPSAEVCDGIDNDCDGEIDEGNPGGGQACTTGLPGACAAGTTRCSGGTIRCIQNVQPSGEVCNGIDDDCDGVVDGPNAAASCPARDNATKTCVNGACGFTCIAGFADCDGQGGNGCETNTDTDEAHCGRCNRACPTGATCIEGNCFCPSDATTVCGGACVDVQSDETHCGRCTNPCGGGQICVNGVCGIACTSPTDCPAPPACKTAVCTSGRCGLQNAQNATPCGGDPNGFDRACTNGVCVSGFTSCRSVGGSCTSNGACCSGDCSNPGFGGVCEGCARSNQSCQTSTDCCSGLSCRARVCTFCSGPGGCPCASGLTNCRGFCRNLQTDPAGCGTCGNVCPTGATCAAGTCSCPPNHVVCGNRCVDPAGFQTDPNNCGECGRVCTGGKVCQAGACACPAETTECGGTCRNLQTDPANCNVCGRVCPVPAGGTATCQGGVCGGTCPGGPPPCGATAGQAGSCCGSGATCLGGACCPDERVCGNACCGDGFACAGGGCCLESRACGPVCCGGQLICQDPETGTCGRFGD